MGNPRGCQHPSTWAYLEWRGQRLASRTPRLLVIGQDPAGLENCTVDDWMPGDNPTNRNLRTLLEATGLVPSEVHLTNAVLCLKPGGMSDDVPKDVKEKCRPWLAETIRVLQPQAIAALGRIAGQSLCLVYGIPTSTLKAAERTVPIVAHDGTGLFGRLNHPVATNPGRRGGRPLALQVEDWRAIGEWLRGHPRTKLGSHNP